MRRTLDLGCGEGKSLADEPEPHLLETPATSPAQVQMVGIDIDMKALRKAKKFYPQLGFVCARGEQLPFREKSFELVISRVAMPYMDIPITLGEVQRVLKSGGQLRIKLHPLSFTWSELLTELQFGPLWRRAQNLVYRIYVIGNGAALHLFGFNFRFPLARHRCESFQTKYSIQRALKAVGFENIDISCWVTKIKRPHAGNCWAIASRGS